MALDINNIPTNYILSSRESIRKKLIDRIQEFEQLANVDLSKTHFFSYIIDILSILSADNSNSLTMSRKENYLVTAQMPSSIYNWASYLSYKKDFATPSKTNLLLTIDLDFKNDSSFIIPEKHKFYANEIIFTLDHTITITYNKTLNKLSAVLQKDSNLIDIKTIVSDNKGYLTIPVSQIEFLEFDKLVDGTLKLYQPFTFNVSYREFINDIKLYVQEDENSIKEEWLLNQNYFTMNLGEKSYSISIIDNINLQILFGNGVFGKQPIPNSIITGEILVTKASYGNVIAGTITTMDPILYNEGGITKRVKILCNNIESSVGGTEEETLNDTKRKSINRFTARERIVSHNDFSNMKDIVTEGLPFPVMSSILKRSDIKTNEVVSYVIIPIDTRVYKPTGLTTGLTGARLSYIPVPTNSITQVFSNTTTEILPYTVFTDSSDGPNYTYNYVCPFGIIIESPTFAYYYYMVNNVDIGVVTNLSNTAQYPLYFDNLNLESINSYQDLKLTLSYKNPNNISMTDIQVVLYIKFKSSVIGPFTCNIDDNTHEITYTINTNGIKSEDAEITYEFYDTSGGGNYLFTILKSNYFIKRNLKNRMISYCKPDISAPNTISCYDIPCIEETYWNGLTSEEKKNFELTTLQQFVGTLNLADYRMTSVKINIKFAKTHGRIHTYDLNEVSHEPVIDILNTPPSSPNQGDRYIVGQDPTGVWENLTNAIVTYAGSSWFPIFAKPSEIIYITNKSIKMTYSGNANRWIEVLFETPFRIKVYAYVNSISLDDIAIINTIKQNILYAICPNFDIQGEISRSIMYESVQTLREIGIINCEIKIPEVNISFNFDIDNFTTQQLIQYVPVYIYTTEDNIDVIIKRK